MRGGKTAVARRARSKAGAKGEECVGKRRPPRARAIEQLPCHVSPPRASCDLPRRTASAATRRGT